MTLARNDPDRAARLLEVGAHLQVAQALELGEVAHRRRARHAAQHHAAAEVAHAVEDVGGAHAEQQQVENLLRLGDVGEYVAGARF